MSKTLFMVAQIVDVQAHMSDSRVFPAKPATLIDSPQIESVCSPSRASDGSELVANIWVHVAGVVDPTVTVLEALYLNAQPSSNTRLRDQVYRGAAC